MIIVICVVVFFVIISVFYAGVLYENHYLTDFYYNKVQELNTMIEMQRKEIESLKDNDNH